MCIAVRCIIFYYILFSTMPLSVFLFYLFSAFFFLFSFKIIEISVKVYVENEAEELESGVCHNFAYVHGKYLRVFVLLLLSLFGIHNPLCSHFIPSLFCCCYLSYTMFVYNTKTFKMNSCLNLASILFFSFFK